MAQPYLYPSTNSNPSPSWTSSNGHSRSAAGSTGPGGQRRSRSPLPPSFNSSSGLPSSNGPSLNGPKPYPISQSSFLHQAPPVPPHRNQPAKSLSNGLGSPTHTPHEVTFAVPPPSSTNDGESGKKSTRFGSSQSKENIREEKNKILTMKYGKQQMILIRKRLKVEMWLLEALEELFDDEDMAVKCDIDIDEMLDLDSEPERKQAIMKKLTENNCQASPQDTEEFLRDFLDKLATL